MRDISRLSSLTVSIPRSAASLGSLTVLLMFGIIASGVALGPVHSPSQGLLNPDRTVTNAQGEQLSFERDVLDPGPVLVGFIFTRCEKNCPRLAKRLDALTDDLNQLPQVQRPRIVLISIDPDYDSPEQLRQWAAGYRNGSKWMLLTGRADDLNAIAQALTGSIPSRGEHSPNLIFVDVAHGVDRSIYGFASTSDLLTQITHQDYPKAQPLAAKSPREREPKEPRESKEPAPVNPQPGGQWEHITDWSVVAVHAALLPTGRVLFWPRFDASGDFIPTTGNDGSKTPQAWVWDPSIPIGNPGRFVNVPNPNTNLFCGGQALLPDGRVMVIGGHDPHAGGHASPSTRSSITGFSTIFTILKYGNSHILA